MTFSYNIARISGLFICPEFKKSPSEDRLKPRQAHDRSKTG
jgi:hypothetical protein